MNKILQIFFFLLLTLNIAAQEGNLKARRVLVGADMLLSENIDLIKNKKVGIITNQTAFLLSRKHLLDSLINRTDLQIKALFVPDINYHEIELINQHSTREGYYHSVVPVYRLYQDSCRFTKEMLKDVDILIYDIQDIGVRFSPFVNILYHSLLASAEYNIPMVVLDRPNPTGGTSIYGPIPTRKNASDDLIPIPIIYGMTTGELANMLNNSGLTGKSINAPLTVIKMKSWERGLYFDKCNIKWIRPLPYLDYIVSVILYPGINLFEGTNISIGKGTVYPFQLIGAPFINSDSLITELKTLNLKGIEFSKADFTPVDFPDVSAKPKYINKLCHGIKLSVTNRYKFDVINFSINLMSVTHKLYKKQFRFDNNVFDKLIGNSRIREQLLQNKSPEQLNSAWQKDLEIFNNLRNKYLLY
jgi:uncharacterized protein YbbC (DUF1343 family)